MTDEADPVVTLRDAASDLRETRDRVEEVGVENLRAVNEAYRAFDRTLDDYEDRATDWDDFQGYVEFREELGERLASLPDDLPHREAFEAADEELTTNVRDVLSAADFERARERLAPARETAALADRWQRARERYRDARRAVVQHRERLRERVTERERVRELGDADLDAPVERLRDPIEAYDEGVREAFAAFKSEAAARALVEVVDETAAYPLVEFRRPPDRLLDYLRETPLGEESVPVLLEYAGYSRSKLEHYVDDPQAFGTAVATNETYLRRLDATPLTVGWPPPPADRLRWRARELVSVVGRFADESVVALARDVRALADREDYERLRESALARARLGEEERERVADGAVERELREARERLERVESALAEHPALSALDDPGGESGGR